MDEGDQGDSQAAQARAKRVQAVIEEVRRRRRAGDAAASDEAVLAAHPDLLPELTAALSKLRLIQQAGQAAEHARDSVAARGGLHIRCPHCHNPIEVVERDSLNNVTCPSCGSNFSLITGDTTHTHHGKAQRVAHFELLDQVGQGAFGVVWKARDTVLQRTVALKIPRRGQFTPEEAEFFFRDARAAAQLNHPGIVSVYEVGREGNTLYIASEFIEGATLADWIERRPLTPREAAQLLVQVAEAIQHAHERGVIHRDLKPGNILLDMQGQPHVADFGLAKRDAGEITMTVDGQVLGTPAYMSPEQAAGKAHEVDGRSDVYSLAVILFELLTGELPFRGSKAMLVVQILNDEPPSLRKLSARVPRDLETICQKAMSKEPDRRYATAKDLAADLKRYVEGQPILARPVGRVERTWRWCKRNPVVAGLLAAVLLSLTAGVAVSTLFGWRESVQRAAAESLAGERGRLLGEKTTLANQKSKLADQKAKLAEKNAELAQNERRLRQQSELQRARLMFDRGWTKYSEGHIDSAMLVWCRALAELERPREDAADERAAPTSEVTALTRGVREHILHASLRGDCPQACFPSGSSETRVIFNHDGTNVATASKDGTARIWDTVTGKPLGKLMRHDGSVYSIRYSRDGTKLATGSEDKTAQVWDATTGESIGQPFRHDNVVYSVEFSPDGTRLATASADNTARLWNVATGRIVGEPLKHDNAVYTVAFSSDGTMLATASNDQTARLWEVSSCQPLGQPFKHNEIVGSAVFSPDGTKLATACWDETARLWDVATGKQIGETLRGSSRVRKVLFSPDGRKLAMASVDGTVRLWDVATDQPLEHSIRHEGAVNSIDFSPDGTKLATASADATARLLDVASGQLLGEPLMHDHAVYSVAFSPDGTKLATGSHDATARLWDLAGGGPTSRILQHSSAVLAVMFCERDTKLATTSSDHDVVLWDALTGKPLGKPFRPTGTILSISLSPDGTKLASVSVAGSAQLWFVANGKPFGAPLTQFPAIQSVVFSPDGNKLAAAGGRDVQLWNVETTLGLRRGRTMRNSKQVVAMRFTPDGTKLGIVMSDGSTNIRNVAKDSAWSILLRHSSSQPSGSIYSMLFGGRDGSRVATVASDGTVHLWDLATDGPWDVSTLETSVGSRLWDFAAGHPPSHPRSDPLPHNGGANSASLSIDGTTLATAIGRTARLWRTPVGKPLGDPFYHPRLVNSVAFSRDGSKLATSTEDNSIRLWDLATGKPLGKPLQHRGAVNSVTFSSDNAMLATASDDSIVRLWDVPRVPDESAHHLLLWAETIAGAEADEAGQIRRLTPEEMLDKYLALDKAGGPPRAYQEALERRRLLVAKEHDGHGP